MRTRTENVLDSIQSQPSHATAPAATSGSVDSSPDIRVTFAQTLSVELFELGISETRPELPDDACTAVYDQAKAAKLFGLALSGGGIRSATFNLGVIQALASNSLLGKFHYMSTVSGGGYIGMWLSALVHRITGGDIQRAEAAIAAASELKAPQTKLQSVEDVSKAAHAIFFLRQYSNYLTPRKRLLSGDTLAAAGTYLRNVTINQLILVLVFSALMTIPYWAAWSAHRLFQHTYVAWAGALLLVGAAVLMGLCIWAVPAPGDKPSHSRFWSAQPVLVATSIGLTLMGVLALTIALFGRVPPVNFTEVAADNTVAPQWPSLTPFVVWFAVGYALLWLVGACAAFSLRLISRYVHERKQNAAATKSNDDAGAESTWPGWPDSGLIVLIAFVAGLIGGYVTYQVTTAIELWLSQPKWHPFFAWGVTGIAFPAIVFCIWCTLTIHTALASERFHEARREWWARVGGMVLALSLGWTLLVALSVLAAPTVKWGELTLAAGGLTWLVTTIGGVLLGKSKLTPAIDKPSSRQILSKIAPSVFVLGFLFLIAWGVHSLLSAVSVRVVDRDRHEIATCIHDTNDKGVDEAFTGSSDSKPSYYAYAIVMTCNMHAILEGPWNYISLCTLALLGAGLGLGRCASINLFSLNNFYGNRLTRCYVGASTQPRSPNPFTGLAYKDRVDFRDLGPRDGKKTQKPIHIVNTALNLVGGKELAWQQRKAAAFSFTPLFTGFALPPTTEISAEEGFWPTAIYAGGSGPSMGNLMAISGAAASPNMGYHSDPAMGFLLTVFNVRLGRWCANPASNDARIISRHGPAVGWWFLLKELFGMTSAVSDFVYLSDGGHFENLGLYELVRRRCQTIVVSDASHDPNYTFEDLGNAIRKCRVDLGVEITINVDPIRLRKDTAFSSDPVAVGEIRYPGDGEIASGRMIFIKTGLTGEEPAELREYKANHPEFPHRSTSDQFFDEPTFESYRSLGRFIGERLCSTLSKV